METRGEDREGGDQTSEVIIVSEEVFTIGGRICSVVLTRSRFCQPAQTPDANFKLLEHPASYNKY